MIPIRLSLTNFMCYRQNATLNFNNFRLACLSGENGHGKSALLDAMTWALWGKTRARTTDELVYQGQTEMSVEFEFDAGSNHYRLIRRYIIHPGRASPGTTIMELSSGSNGQYQPLTSGVKDTEHKIVELLKLDYDTFVNSAFLRQGKADEFTRQTAGKRKEILASILNLSIYDRAEKKAKENCELKKHESSQLKAVIENNSLELSKLDSYKEQKSLLDRSLQDTSLEMERARVELENFRNEKQRLEIVENQTRQKKENLSRLKEDEKSLISRIEKHQGRITGFLNLINRKQEIESLFTKYLAVKKEEQSLSEKFATLARLKDKKSALEKAIELEGSEIKKAHSHRLRTVQDLEDKIASKPDRQKTSEELQKKSSLIQSQTVDLERQKGEQTKYRENIATCQADQKRFSAQIEELIERKSLISKGDSASGGCPLCGSPLGQEGITKIQEHYKEELQLAEKAKQGAGEKLRVVSGQLTALSAQIKELEKTLEIDKAKYEREKALCQKELQEIEEAESKIASEKGSLEALTLKLERGAYALEQRMEIYSLVDQIKVLDYSDERHQALKTDLWKLEQYQKQKYDLDAAEKDIEREKAEQTDDEEAIILKREQILSEETELGRLAQDLLRLPVIKEKFHHMEKALKIKEQEREGILQQLGGIESRIKGCMEKEQENLRLEDEKRRAEHEMDIYEKLAQSFGKRGIQAHIIEASLPEISAEADELLSRLTDHRMNLKLEMRAESPGGKIVESLDIKIADELGTRNYEMFSGGEAFRIDFALRIALSRFLARRHGAPLSLLIIDEGFGSQDETGKERLVEALNHIQYDFDKILVITHLPELKDSFPYRINISKTDGGSTISLEEG